VLLEHLPRDGVNLRLGYHVALLMFRRSEPQHRSPPVAGSLSNGPTGVSFRHAPENSFDASLLRLTKLLHHPFAPRAQMLYLGHDHR
jgi:hypothetical protein